MKRITIGLLLILNTLHVTAQKSYKLIDSAGQEVSWTKIANTIENTPFVFFGELHDQKLAHQAQLDFLKILHQQYPDRITLAMEMFEADVQPIIDEYFSGQINQRSFETEARVWKNYKQDYKPLVEFAKENHIELLATNIPRRYANAVYHQGIDILPELSEYAKQFLPPLPLQIDTTIRIYREMANMVPSHEGSNMLYSQAAKDATMAHFIMQHKTSGNIILHLNGAYHSKNKQGIPSFLTEVPLQQILTINTALETDDLDLSTADYTLLLY